jgi:hypothetical protein
MRNFSLSTLLLTFVAAVAAAQSTPAPAPTLKSVLLSQLKTTHDQQDWFVPRASPSST